MSAKPSVPKIEAPLPLNTLKVYAQEIFVPIRRGESVSTVWVPMAGRRVRNKFIIGNQELFIKEIGNDKKYLLVYVEPLELTEESRLGFFKLIAQSITEAFHKFYPTGKLVNPKKYYYSTLVYSDQLTRLKSLLKEITDQGFEVVLFIGEFDELDFADTIFYNNLKSIWVALGKKLHFVFLLQKDLARPEQIERYGDFNEVLLQNVIYIPLFEGEEIDYLLDYFSKEFSREFNLQERQLIHKVCGGHPFLVKASARIIAHLDRNKFGIEELEKLLLSHYETRSVCQKLFGLLPEEEKKALQEMVKTKVATLPSSLSIMENLKLVKKDGEYWIPFGTLFESVVGNQQSLLRDQEVLPGSQTFQIKNGSIFVAGVNMEEKFTRQEYEVLNFLLSDPEKLRSRDEIGEAMWGKLAYEKYSDWAIDQAMSKIRKKLKGIGADKYLVTVRGRGYKLATSAKV